MTSIGYNILLHTMAIAKMYIYASSSLSLSLSKESLVHTHKGRLFLSLLREGEGAPPLPLINLFLSLSLSRKILLYTAQEWTNRTPNATNKSILHFLLLPGSESSFTEITEYVYFSLK